MKKEKSCGAIIFSDNKVLMIKSKNGYYGFPKGHMENSETEMETAIREVKEETNIDIEIHSNFKSSLSYTIEDKIEKEVVYFIGYPISFNIIPQIEEIDEIKWVSINDVESLLQFDNIKKLWRDTLNLFRKGEFYE